MPFANKYRFTMRIPEPGGRIGDFVVESCDVGHEGRTDGIYDYPIRIVLSGAGGQQAVRKTIREQLSRGRTTFSGYGNPYQLRFGRFEVESLGDRRYLVTACGVGFRFDLERELRRFAQFAQMNGVTANEALIERYLEAYSRDVTRRNPDLEY